MSSSLVLSTKPYKNHASFNRSYKTNTPKSSVILLTSLWTFSSIINVMKLSVNHYLTGISVEISLKEALILCFIVYSLHKGIATRNILLVMPWIGISLFSLYFNHYMTIMKLAHVLKSPRISNVGIAWVAYTMYLWAFIIRLALVFRILQISANMWYRKKLEKELFETVN